jgi:hypothetical protein
VLKELMQKLGRYKAIKDRVEETLVYMERYYLVFPRRKDDDEIKPFNAFIHNIHRSDPEGFHDHPWPWASLIIWGAYIEHTPKGSTRRSGPSWSGWRKATDLHRLELNEGSVWTLFLHGKRLREWGFVSKLSGVWVYWEDYVAQLRAR